MENYGSVFVGAKVEFEDVYFSLTDLTMRWNRLQVTDPKNTMTNLFETSECNLDIDPIPLLSKKINVETITVKGLKFNTPRETDGKLSEAEKQALEEEMPVFIRELHQNLREEAAHMPVFNLGQLTRKLNVDSVYALLDLKSPQKIDSLKTVSQQKCQAWEMRIDELPTEEDFRTIEAQINSINPNNLNKIDELKNALVTAKSLTDKLNQYKNQYNDFKSNFEVDLKLMRQTPAEAQQWIATDYQRALNLAKLPDISVRNVAKLLFGQRIIDRVESITGYIGTARYYANKFKSASPVKESPPRLEGQYVHFGKHLEPPKFWIKHIDLSGELSNGLQLAGNALNIVSDQKNIEQPTSFLLGGVRSDKTSLNLEGFFNYLGDSPQEKISLNLENFSLDGIKLTDFAILPSAIKSGKGYLKADVDFSGDAFLSGIQFTGKQVQFAEDSNPKNLNSQLEKASNAITRAISEIKFNAGIQQKDGKFNFRINSNLDNLIASELKQLASDEVVKARQKLETKVNRETEKYKESLNSLVQTNISKLRTRADSVENAIKDYQSRVDQAKRDIEKKIEKKAAGKLLDIFK